MLSDKPYAVTLSFAGEDRSYAEALANALDRRGVKVFYDKYEKDTLWGKDLYTYLSDLYQNRAHYCVMFISRHYAAKLWTNHERKAAQACAFRQYEEYILPVRLDDTEIPGILSTTGYLRWPPEDAESIADIIMVKLGRWPERALLSFYKARQKVEELANQWPQTAELLSAGTLRTLYLKRDKYFPSDPQKTVLFRNLLLRGRGKHRKQRMRKPDTATSETAPSALGWFWFSDMGKEESLDWIKKNMAYPHIFVRAGVVRALGRFGSTADSSVLREKLDDNARVASEAVRALARLGTDDDIDFIRGFQDDRRDEVLMAVADALARRGSNTDVAVILRLSEHTNPMVKRHAVRALGFIATPDVAIPVLESIRNNPTEPGEVQAAVTGAVKRLTNVPFEPIDSYERRVREAESKLSLTAVYSEDNRKEAQRLLFAQGLLVQEVAVRWIISHESREEIAKMIADLGAKLPFHVLQRIDYYAYCPHWWRDAMDQPVD